MQMHIDIISLQGWSVSVVGCKSTLVGYGTVRYYAVFLRTGTGPVPVPAPGPVPVPVPVRCRYQSIARPELARMPADSAAVPARAALGHAEVMAPVDVVAEADCHSTSNDVRDST